MEAPLSKQFRENDNSTGADLSFDIARPNSSTSNPEEELTPTIPSFVSHLFLTNLRDVRLLKHCRLVCKCWNIDACISLRACTKVVLLENNTDFNIKIRQLLLKRESGPLKNLPSPFNFQAVAHWFSYPDFNEMVLHPNVTIKNLTFNLGHQFGNQVPSELRHVLAANQYNITDLSIKAIEHDSWSYEELLADEEIKPKALKRFQLKDDCHECTHIPFLKHFLSSCKLERIDLTISDEDMLIGLIEDKVLCVRHLSIRMERGIFKAVLNHLSNLLFLKLQSLTFEACNLVNETSLYSQELCLFYQSVSRYLKDFTTNIAIENTFEVRFPYLQKINVRNNTAVSVLNPNSFPALSKVCLKVTESLLTNVGNDVVPHRGVRSLVISISIVVDHSEQDLSMFLTYLSCQFPNVSTLMFSTDDFVCSDLMAIYESFPQLKTLHLGGKCYELFDCSCDGVNILEGFCPDADKYQRLKSFMELMELESIVFEGKFFVHPDLIMHCLPNLPKLKCITLPWNKHLSAELLLTFVGRIEKIVISYSSRFTNDEMADISRIFPNTVSFC